MIQPFLFDKVNLHDSCGVNNLHGIPGVLGGLFSVAMTAIATERGPMAMMAVPMSMIQRGMGPAGTFNRNHA